MDRDQRWERTERAFDAIVAFQPCHGDRARRVRAAAVRRGCHGRVRRAGPLRGRPGIEPGDTAIFFNFRPDRARQLSQKLLEAGDRPDDDDPLPGRPRLPGRVRGAGRTEHDRRGAGRKRRPSAALRRDREVRPRHLLLQRRPRGGVAGRDAHPRPVARATSAPTTRSPRCPRRRSPSASPPRSATAIASGSSTSRTRTWSGTPARSRRRSPPSRRPTAASAEVLDAVEQAGGVALVTADHGNAETMLAEDGVSPHTAHTTNPVPLVVTAPGSRPARGRRALRPGADLPRSARHHRSRRR